MSTLESTMTSLEADDQSTLVADFWDGLVDLCLCTLISMTLIVLLASSFAEDDSVIYFLQKFLGKIY
jgi:hypothetical protein